MAGAATMKKKKRSRPSSSARLYLRATPRESALIRNVAATQGTSVTEFVLQAACARARDLLMDRSQFELPAKRYEEFVAALDRPVQPKPALRRLFSEPTILER